MTLYFFTIHPVLIGCIIAYAIAAYIFIVIDNRSPQSTFAWLFLFYLLPGFGLVIYALVGRGRHAFSDEDKLFRQFTQEDIPHPLMPWLKTQANSVTQLKAEGLPVVRKLLELLRHRSSGTLALHNRIEVLQNAAQKYPWLLADLRAAQHSIHMVYYEWASDPFTEQLKTLLIQKAQSGLEVRILFDPVGSFSMLTNRYVREMNAGGVQMFPFSSLYKLHTIGYRSHRKLTIIDGKIGYAGGMNITQKHIHGPHGFYGWRDTHLRIIGEAVHLLQATFLTSWYNSVGVQLAAEPYFPPIDPTIGRLPVQLVNSGPDSEWQAIRQLYFFLIVSAEHHVYIQSPFFILDEAVAEALRASAMSGVDVRVMLAPSGEEATLPYRAGRTYAASMVKAGVKVYYYQGAYFHPKTVMVDSAVCSVGSANMDIRSFSINYETNVVIYDSVITQRIERDFLKDLEQCVQFSPEEYQERFFTRLGDSTTRLFSPLL